MDNFPPPISSSSDDNDSDEDLILYTLLSATRDVVHERGESSNVEKKHRKWINRDCEAAHEHLVHDYFVVDSLYDLSKFKERLCISRTLFLRIARDLACNYEFFQLRWDVKGKHGFTTIQKCTGALRQLGYGITADTSDEYLKMSERTGRECTYLFCEYVIELYHDIYMRHPTKSDVEQLYVTHQAKHGFSGMLDSIDCTHWEWENCPNAWCGQFTRGDHGVPTVILEAVVSNDLWFLHAFFGMTGSNNDLNLLQASPIFNDILQGRAPEIPYVVSGNEYKYGYYLGDGIYLEYATFVKSYTFPADDKRKMFKLAQESARKDVERAFGVFKQNWHIIKHPARTWDRDKLRTVLTAYVILHNMIIEEEGQNNGEDDDDVDEEDDDGADEADDTGDDNDDD
ncbi:uncharacterized protein LOC111917758 [Lactuca sativa]|uniref:uncharacterized protein LOC111917758 n=1 Tax=Lactuca sativa TaxID=4236 RepID=UPI000CD8D509|nr:uncharacterized protein LOC111917758 [Lactuca sativa]